MRHWVGLVLAVALVASPLSVRAQGVDPLGVNEAARNYVRRARGGVIGSCIAVGAGAGLLAGSVLYYNDDRTLDDWKLGPNIAMGVLGVLATLGGLIGAGISSARLSDAKRQLGQEERLRSSRMQWDPRTSRFVF